MMFHHVISPSTKLTLSVWGQQKWNGRVGVLGGMVKWFEQGAVKYKMNTSAIRQFKFIGNLTDV